MKRIIKISILLVLIIISIGIVSAAENSTDDSIYSTTDLDNYSSKIEEIQSTSNQESISTTNLEQLSNSKQDPLSATYDSSVYDRVEKSTKADRTFKLGKYKITLNKDQYSDFVYIKNTEQFFLENGDYNYYEIGDRYGGGTYHVSSCGLYHVLEKYTGKTVKQKIGIGFKRYDYKTFKTFKTKAKAKKYYKKHELNNRWPYEYTIKKVNVKNKVKYRIIKATPLYKKIKTKKAKVYIIISYGDCQCGIAQRFLMSLTTNYQNPGYDVVSGWISGCKISKNIYTLILQN